MIILSIPYSLKDDPIVQSINKDTDFIEYRLDYGTHLGDFDVSSLTPKTIVTIRDSTEGGIHSFTRMEKLQLYKNVLRYSEALVDDEIFHYLKEDHSLNPERLILSWHAKNNENAYQVLHEIVELSNRLPAHYLKLAIEVNTYSQLTILHTELSLSNKPVLFAGLGKLGKLARMLYTHLGSVGTYIGIQGQETALGQLTYEESQIFGLRSINAAYHIGGIIGGEQVWNSKGLTYYSQVFRQKSYPAAYLPFQVTDWDDFWKWFTASSKFISFYGFSITMPWKKSITESINSETKIANCFLPGKNEANYEYRAINNDEIAFRRSLLFLNFIKGASVLIFGTGAMAEMALSIMSGYPNICIYGRNEKRQKELSDVYHVSQVSKNALNDGKWSLLINCTPLGMKGVPDNTLLQNLHFDNVIDLPYSKTETPLVRFCRKKNIPVISGDVFWKWQSEKQEELFLQEIESLR